MDFISLALAALKLFNWITARIDKTELRADERRKVFQEQMMIANDRLGISAKIQEDSVKKPINEIDKDIGDDFID